MLNRLGKTAPKLAKAGAGAADGELVILTGMSGSGKASALKAFEDLGYYSVDNLPLELVTRFADLVRQSAEIERAALAGDVRSLSGALGLTDSDDCSDAVKDGGKLTMELANAMLDDQYVAGSDGTNH